MIVLLVALAVLLVSWASTAALLRYALAHSVLDIPNERSSHSVATPRGGGLAVVLAFLGGIVALTVAGVFDQAFAYALCGGGVAVATVGFVDDHLHVRAIGRLIVHFAALGWAVYCMGGLPPVDIGITILDLGVPGSFAAVVFLVWFLNLYNFMDGIDAIAAVEAISVAASSALLMSLRGNMPDAVAGPVLLLAAVAGFLFWNWPPARIFLGDVGSGFLGFVLGVFAVYTVVKDYLPLWAWLILYGSFFADASVTLFRRWRRGERIYDAHRSHAYQRLSRYWRKHLPVTLVFLALNVLWLLPMAVLATLWPRIGAALTLIAWAPLLWAAWRLGAGLNGDLGHGTT